MEIRYHKLFITIFIDENKQTLYIYICIIIYSSDRDVKQFMKLEYFLLGFLHFKPFTGYEIKKYLDREGRFVRTNTPLSQIYNTLKSMTKKEWIYFEETKGTGKIATKTYYLTELGQHIFITWLREPPEEIHEIGTFAGKFMFFSLLDKETVLSHLNKEITFREKQVQDVRYRDRKIEDLQPSEQLDEDKIMFYLDSLHEFGTRRMDTYIVWLKRAIGLIEATDFGEEI
jgi:PadR family transcriptional regulator, regulatory protein AphA